MINKGINNNQEIDDLSIFKNNPNVGIFMLKHDDVNNVNKNSIFQNSYNKKFKINEFLNSIEPFNTSDSIFIPSTDKVDFIAYHPYFNNNLINNNHQIKIQLHDKKNISENGILFAKADNNGNGYDKNNHDKILFEFTYTMSQLIFNIKPGVGISNSDLSFIEIELEGRSSQGYLDLLNGITFSHLENISNIKLSKIENQPNSFTTILFPEDRIVGSKAIFKIKNDEYYWDMSSIDLKSGKQYTINVIIDKTGIYIDKESSITDWIYDINKENGCTTND